MSELRGLYPAIDCRVSGHLDVGDGHHVHYEVCGNPDGKAVVFVHGGPGGGVTGAYRRLFDPAAYRIILFDQRGCGSSKPHASLEANTNVIIQSGTDVTFISPVVTLGNGFSVEAGAEFKVNTTP